MITKEFPSFVNISSPDNVTIKLIKTFAHASYDAPSEGRSNPVAIKLASAVRVIVGCCKWKSNTRRACVRGLHVTWMRRGSSILEAPDYWREVVALIRVKEAPSKVKHRFSNDLTTSQGKPRFSKNRETLHRSREFFSEKKRISYSELFFEHFLYSRKYGNYLDINILYRIFINKWRSK